MIAVRGALGSGCPGQAKRLAMSRTLARLTHRLVPSVALLVVALLVVASLAVVAVATLPAIARDPGTAEPASSPAAAPAPAPAATAPRVSAIRTGAIPTKDSLRLTLTADTGNIRILTDAHGEVRYRVRIEAEASDPAASKRLEQFTLAGRGTAAGVALTGQMPGPRDADRVWVTYEVHVPRRYSLEISTQAGDIVTQDIDGRVVLSTGGGNIQAGSIGDPRQQSTSGGPDRPPHRILMARLDTAGGHILVGNVAGSLRASTAGGHITAGNIDGDAILQTAGGHIHVGRVTGAAQLSTGGGDIVAESADDGVVAETGGGRMEFGEVAGVVHARTAGGGIRIGRIAGPTALDSSDGGILLAGVQAPLHASTRTGTITAWFAPQFGGAAASGATSGAPDAARAAAPSELTSEQGDIIVYLPRKMPLTIDALVQQSADRNIVADHSVALRVRYEDSSNGRALHGQCDLNGGGEVLHLKTASGNIQLRFLDADVERRLAAQQADLLDQRRAAQRALSLDVQRQLATQAAEMTFSGASATSGGALTGENAPRGAVSAAGATGAAGAAPASAARGSQPPSSAEADPPGTFAELRRRLESFWSSELPVTAEDEQNRLLRSVAPEYPEIARQAGVEGDVTLRVVVGKDGAVEDVAPISGDPVLARAAMEAIEHWRYSPARLGGRPIGVVTTVTVAFRLQ